MRGVAYLTDPENWTEYAPEDSNALFAIGGPTVELFRASFNATLEFNDEAKELSDFTIENSGSREGTPKTTNNSFTTKYNEGIYRYGTWGAWWLASPSAYGNNMLWIVAESYRLFQQQRREHF